eukprot:CAMPEP_0178984380 /NCGR_PEP_ID=MMETSP0795-20121207/1570_1 /TAXON_ID=88552 /ORGANISM="Amoebophrya sp., Strain Ameob2" /LENGTH=636 /DNA_ID=CAMNT_0020675231 /DNA_START=1957 /DNA_END=3864 /DNA_ORIENTATION=-
MGHNRSATATARSSYNLRGKKMGVWWQLARLQARKKMMWCAAAALVAVEQVVDPTGTGRWIVSVGATLNLDPHAVSKQVKDQRERIFVDVKFVEPQPHNTAVLLPSGEVRRELRKVSPKLCSSADGPLCFQDEAFGVIPPSLVQNLGRTSPESRFEVDGGMQRVNYEHYLAGGNERGQDLWEPANADMNLLSQLTQLTGAEKLPRDVREVYPPVQLPGAAVVHQHHEDPLGALPSGSPSTSIPEDEEGDISDSTSTSSRVSSSTSGGGLTLLSASDLAPLDRRVPPDSESSYGLPEGITSTWEGKWVVTEDVNGKRGAELSSTTGYIRFSKPVIIRSLVLQCGRYVSLVGGRQANFQTVWVRAMRAGGEIGGFGEKAVGGNKAARQGQVDRSTPIIVDLAEDSRQNIGLVAVSELFFLTAERVKLISIEVAAAAGKPVNVLLLGQESELVRSSIDVAATAHVLSLAEMVRKRLVIKTRQVSKADVDSKVVVQMISHMLLGEHFASGADVAEILQSGIVPAKLRKMITEHDLVSNANLLLANVNFDGRGQEHNDILGTLLNKGHTGWTKEGEMLTRYNDLIMSAWLHWIQGMASRTPKWIAREDAIPSEENVVLREVTIPSFFVNPKEELLWRRLHA